MTVVLAPLPGRVVALADVPDPVFAQQMVGSGVAIEPARGQGPLTVVAPISGKILKLHPHAFVIFGEKATGVLVHIGIDTVKLEGDGFTLIAAEGDTVDAGDPVVSFDPAHIDTTGYSAICPVVVMDSKPDTVESPSVGRDVTTGDTLFALSLRTMTIGRRAFWAALGPGLPSATGSGRIGTNCECARPVRSR